MAAVPYAQAHTHATHPTPHTGDDAIWDLAESSLKEALKQKGWSYQVRRRLAGCLRSCAPSAARLAACLLMPRPACSRHALHVSLAYTARAHTQHASAHAHTHSTHAPHTAHPQVDEGGGAFYGPKIDLKIQDAIGRKWQCSTVQLDFNLPQRCARARGEAGWGGQGEASTQCRRPGMQGTPPSALLPAPRPPRLPPCFIAPRRFDMMYMDQEASKQRPIMIHRAIFGSIERFFGILIENYAGAFPIWLAPMQARAGAAGRAAACVCAQHHPAVQVMCLLGGCSVATCHLRCAHRSGC